MSDSDKESKRSFVFSYHSSLITITHHLCMTILESRTTPGFAITLSRPEK